MRSGFFRNLNSWRICPAIVTLPLFIMVTNAQLIYHKSLNLRAGESVHIVLGETIEINRTHFRIDLQCAPPKTLIFVFTNKKSDDTSIIRHLRADMLRSELDVEGHKEEITSFSELHISVPEDTQFHFGIYLKP
jgi:hypothetical protein